MVQLTFMSALLFLPGVAMAESGLVLQHLDLTASWAGYCSLAVMALAYVAAMFEDVTLLRKSKPMLLGASLIWLAIATIYWQMGDTGPAVKAFRENLLDYIELLLFIMVSMTYLNVMEDMRLFDAMRLRLMQMHLGYRSLFWILGFLVFGLSIVVNGMTAGLLVGTVAIAMGKDSPRFVSLACINIVVACNAGGSFSPLGGISTLFVWQDSVLKFTDFFTLFIPCLVNFLVPAMFMHFAVPKGVPEVDVEIIDLPRGTRRILFLFALTIAMAVGFETIYGLPPAAGMMLGLSLLQFFIYFLMKTDHCQQSQPREAAEQREAQLDFFEKIGRLEWDTLLFFYGAMVGIGGLAFIGYLDKVSMWLYTQHSATMANILIGLSSAFVDNGTLMFAVLAMRPDLPEGQWLLVTLTLGVGGSLLAIGSAPGIGLLGISRGYYSFADHMKWSPAILLGYFAAVGVHFLVNARYF